MFRFYLSFFIFFTIFVSSFSYINIYPLSFNKRIDGFGGIEDFILTNNTNKKLKYQINIKKANLVDDMSLWTEIYPRIITLSPGEKAEIKMYVRSPKNIALVSLYNFKYIKNNNSNNIKLNGKIKNHSLKRVKLDVILTNEKNNKEVLLSQIKLKKNDNNYSNLNVLKIYEQGTGKILVKKDLL